MSSMPLGFCDDDDEIATAIESEQEHDFEPDRVQTRRRGNNNIKLEFLR